MTNVRSLVFEIDLSFFLSLASLSWLGVHQKTILIGIGLIAADYRRIVLDKLLTDCSIAKSFLLKARNQLNQIL